MRNGILMTLLLWCSLSYPQSILKHEKKVDIDQKYLSREINFINSADNVFLSGTLIEPKNGFDKMVIIVPGSGKDTRHSHPELAKILLENNIAVYRFDDRGVGKSKGIYSNDIDLLATDVFYAMLKMKGLYQHKKIGFLSHSLGGMAVTLANYATSNITKPDFLIQIASPVTSFSDATQHQIQTLKHYHIPKLTLTETKSVFHALIKLVTENSNLSTAGILEKGYEFLNSQNINKNEVKFWTYTHIKLFQYDLKKYYQLIDVPTLYLIGMKDKYINARQQITTLKELENSLIKIEVFKELNHYLIKQNFNSNNIYAINKIASKSIIEWINKI